MLAIEPDYRLNHSGADRTAVPAATVMLFDVRQDIHALATLGSPAHPMLSNSEQAIAQNREPLTHALGYEPGVIACPSVSAMEEAYRLGRAGAMLLPVAHQESSRFAYQYTQVGVLVAPVESIILAGTVPEEQALLEGIHLMSGNQAHQDLVDQLMASHGFRINRRISEGLGSTVSVLESLLKAGLSGRAQAAITTRRSLEYFQGKGESIYAWRELKAPFNLTWIIYQ